MSTATISPSFFTAVKPYVKPALVITACTTAIAVDAAASWLSYKSTYDACMNQTDAVQKSCNTGGAVVAGAGNFFILGGIFLAYKGFQAATQACRATRRYVQYCLRTTPNNSPSNSTNFLFALNDPRASEILKQEILDQERALEEGNCSCLR